MSRLSSALHKVTGGLGSIVKRLGSLSKVGTALVGNPLGNMAFTTPTSAIGKASIAIGGSILGAGLLRGGAGSDSVPQENVGTPYGNAGFVYPQGPTYLPSLGFGSDIGGGGYSGGYGNSNDAAAPPVLSPMVLAMAAVGFLVLILLIFRR